MSKWVIHGHRGSRGTLPENIIPSFEEAYKAGAQWVELDVHLTKDNHVIVYHDHKISGKLCRDAQGVPLQQDIYIGDLTLEEIKSFEIGTLLLSNFPKQKATPGQTIPTLEELIQWKALHAPDLRLNIEIKHEYEEPARMPPPDKIAGAVITLLRKYNLTGESLVQSFDHAVVRAARAIDSELRLSCLFEKEADYAQVTTGCKAQVSAVHFALLNVNNVTSCQKAGLEVLPWTVNEAAEWDRLIGLGITSFITDYPREMELFLSSRS